MSLSVNKVYSLSNLLKWSQRSGFISINDANKALFSNDSKKKDKNQSILDAEGEDLGFIDKQFFANHPDRKDPFSDISSFDNIKNLKHIPKPPPDFEEAVRTIDGAPERERIMKQEDQTKTINPSVTTPSTNEKSTETIHRPHIPTPSAQELSKPWASFNERDLERIQLPKYEEPSEKSTSEYRKAQLEAKERLKREEDARRAARERFKREEHVNEKLNEMKTKPPRISEDEKLFDTTNSNELESPKQKPSLLTRIGSLFGFGNKTKSSTTTTTPTTTAINSSLSHNHSFFDSDLDGEENALERARREESMVNDGMNPVFRAIGAPGLGSLLYIHMPEGSEVHTELGTTIGLSSEVEASSIWGGGLVQAVLRRLGGGSWVVQNLQAVDGSGGAILGPKSMGDIVVVDMKGKSDFNLRRAVHLAHTPTLRLSTSFRLKGGAQWGFFINRVHGKGLLALSASGSIHKLQLEEEEEYLLSAAHMIGWEQSITLTEASARNSFMTRYTSSFIKVRGPGSVFIQSRLAPSLPNFMQSLTNGSSSSNNGNNGNVGFSGSDHTKTNSHGESTPMITEKQVSKEATPSSISITKGEYDREFSELDKARIIEVNKDTKP